MTKVGGEWRQDMRFCQFLRQGWMAIVLLGEKITALQTFGGSVILIGVL